MPSTSTENAEDDDAGGEAEAEEIELSEEEEVHAIGESFGERMRREGVEETSPARGVLRLEFQEAAVRRYLRERDEARVDAEERGDHGDEASRTQGRRIRTKRDEYVSTMEEWKSHRLTHLPYRSWCPECVAGKAVDDAHRRRHEVESTHSPEFLSGLCICEKCGWL